MVLITGIWRDLILACRSLAKARAFTFVCVASLGIGMAPVIGTQYGLRLFTTPPPGLDTDGLVEIVTIPSGRRGATARWSYPDLVDLRSAGTGLSIAAWAVGQSEVVLPDSGDARAATQTMFVTPDYFDLIGVGLARGPGFAGLTDPAVILGFQYWQTRFGSDPGVVGRVLVVDDVAHVVAGIAPEGFAGHMPFQAADLFLALDRHPRLLGDRAARFDRSAAWVRLHGRLRPGVSVEQASAAVSAATARIALEHPATHEHVAGIVASYHPIGNSDLEDLAVMTAVWQTLAAIPLLVVCLNVSGMVQVRTAMRERELSIRQAIGASRRRLVQHLLAEAVVLAALGASLAALVLFNIPPLASWWLGEPLPPQMQQALRVDLSMLAVCAGLCLVTSLLFGWLPAARFSRPAFMTVLKDEAGIGGVRAGRVHRATSALQVAIAVPMLILSAVALERVRATATGDLGFASELLYAAPIDPGDAGNEDASFEVRQILADVSQATGVASATVADGLPLDFRYRLAAVATEPAEATAAVTVRAHVTRVGDRYLETLGIALLGGRALSSDDVAGATPVAVVSRALADRLFPASDAIGQRITFDAAADDDRPPQTLTVVGVTADFPTSQMSTDREQLLLPLAQHADLRRDSVRVNDDREGLPRLTIVTRAALGESPARMTAVLEAVMRVRDPDFDRSTIVTGAGLRQFSVDDFLTQSAVGAIGGGIALLLAALGIYGVVGLMVATRTREIAVRVTLGASRLRVVGMILFDVIKLVAPGVAVGMLLTAALVRLDGGITISAVEPVAYVAGSAIAILAAVLASLAPARRAASVPPIVAMRST